jgi:bacterioferritin
MCESWGYEKLSQYIKKQSIGEMNHAEALLERILFLDGSPTMNPLELTVCRNVQEMLQSDLDLELRAVHDYNTAINWLEAQTHLIKEIGYECYLAMQMGADEED